MCDRTDSDLVRNARMGDKAAFGLLAERYTPMVRRIAFRMIGDDDVAHDLTQEALLQAFLSLENLKSDTSFRSWLYGITLNVCRTYLRSLKHNIYSLDAMLGGIHRDPAHYGPTPEEIVERIELRRVVMDAVQALSPANRHAVLLVYYEDFNLREAARLLGISVTALKGRLHRSRHQLQEKLASLVSGPAEEQGGFDMIPVKIVDVWRKEIVVDADVRAVSMQMILYDENGHRALVIWIGEAEGFAILHGLMNYDAPRPMTHVFIARLLEAANSEVEQVLISALKDETFYATVRVRSGDQVREVDARPSDALALAVQQEIPVYVSADVMEQAGRIIPAGRSPTGKGIESIQEHWRMQQTCWEPPSDSAADKSEQQRNEEISREMENILTAAFG
jgi:RNA polymerase sigma factor (sigma-70 family)